MPIEYEYQFRNYDKPKLIKEMKQLGAKKKGDYLFRVKMAWVVGTEKGYSCLFMEPQHQDYIPMHAVSAIIDTDTLLSDGLFSFFVDKGFKGTIKKGTPLVQVFPFKRDDWVADFNKDFDFNIIVEQRKKVRSLFTGGYKKFYWHKKNYK